MKNQMISEFCYWTGHLKILCVLAIFSIYFALPVVSAQTYVAYTQTKSEYLTLEPILISAQLCNQSNTSVYYQRDSIWQLTLVNQHGDQVFYRGPDVNTIHVLKRDAQGNIVDPRLVQLSAGHCSSVASRNLCDYYGRGDGLSDFFLIPGKYRFWNAYFGSDTVEFEVKDPVNPDDKEAMKLLSEALTNSAAMFPDRLYDFYREFYDKFKGGPYSERALRTLISYHPAIYPRATDSIYQQYVREYILNYPKSRLVLEAIPNLEIKSVPLAERDSIRGVLVRWKDALPTEIQRDEAGLKIRELEQ